MNDIEILEYLEKMQKTFIEEGLQGYEMVIVNTKNFINSLIQRNKDLEQIEKEHKKENGRLRDRIKELEETLRCTQKSWFEDTKKIEIYKMLEANIAKANEIIKDGIPKSLVREKMEKYKKQIEKMEKEDIGIGFTLGKEWSDLKAKVEFGQDLLNNKTN